ncbi:metallophosphoesterase [Emticicia agri]|uniref:Metallophosphoesterase n=1 Tax=Emticicia agri TaxID=2492393 RepID=A0A4Q5LV72_9BACT|nr:metallophosphoesterase [Emticicia agri]RYU93445.1 metallophosphoesterase [Emticicia agri]
MKIQYCSDIHLEMNTNKAYLLQHPIDPVGEVLLLAGDITNAKYYDDPRPVEKQFFKTLSQQFERVFIIAGNHEFYRSWDISVLEKPLLKEIEKNVFLLNNQTIVYKEVAFFFTTLWSEINQLDEVYVKRSMPDFSLITHYRKSLLVKHYNELHKQALAFLDKSLSQTGNLKKMVVSHHLPSLQCVHADHVGSSLGSAFATDLDAFILQHQPDYWVYGHSHRNMPDIEIGKTKLVTNQLGYVPYQEHYSWESAKFFEL